MRQSHDCNTGDKPAGSTVPVHWTWTRVRHTHKRCAENHCNYSWNMKHQNKPTDQLSHLDKSKIVKVLDELQPLHVGRKILHELWSTNKKLQARIFTHPMCAFSVRWCNSIRHVVLGYGFQGHSPGGVAAIGISTT